MSCRSPISQWRAGPFKGPLESKIDDEEIYLILRARRVSSKQSTTSISNIVLRNSSHLRLLTTVTSVSVSSVNRFPHSALYRGSITSYHQPDRSAKLKLIGGALPGATSRMLRRIFPNVVRPKSVTEAQQQAVNPEMAIRQVPHTEFDN